jgi:linoleoyl-CoA desaturase
VPPFVLIRWKLLPPLSSEAIMAYQQESEEPRLQQLQQAPSLSPRDPGGRLTFHGNPGFQVALRKRVDEYFQRTGVRRRDCPRMYLKTAVILASFAASYVLLLFAAQNWWQALLLSILVGLCTAAIGFNIQHDGGHQGYSSRAWVNSLMAKMLDLIGGSSYLWHWKHGVLHHTYVNIAGHDTDIDLGVVGRLSPHQKWHRIYRWQHIYLWPLYGLLAIKWQLFDDFQSVITGSMGGYTFPRPRGGALVVFLGGKAAFFSLALGIPLLFHSVWVVLLYYAVAAIVAGMVLSVVFQLAHCVEQADFPEPRGTSACIENAWAIHQVETTVDFSRRNPIVTWLLGGLNFQVEHHLFPRICHVNYPALSKLVEETCREFGIEYAEHRSVWAGLVSHFRWLRRMGLSTATG